jgi:hypothetical protein
LWLSCQSRADHRGGAPDAAVHLNRAERTIDLTRATFHARVGADDVNRAAIQREHAVRANVHTHSTTRAQSRIEFESVECRHADHYAPPRILMAARAIVNAMPAPNIQAMTGM